ncbi:MAG: GTP-binding protein, partial [Thermoproteus sp.]|nr:GTP-binding protein [Thermoproteus sp.]
TPGVLPAEGDGDLALAVVRGAVDPFSVDDAVPYAVALIERVLRYNPSALEIYGYAGSSAEEALEYVGRRYGRLMKGGKVNIDEAARRIIKDWIEGRLIYYYEPR